MSSMGVDLGIHKVTLSIADGENLIIAETFNTPEGMTRGQELNWLTGWVKEFAQAYAVTHVWIEDTLVGNNRKYSLALTEVLGAVESGLSELPVRVDRVNVGTWKKEVVGNGYANKDAVRLWVTEEFPVYAVTCGDDQDQFDAGCIALYGERVLARAAGLTLA